MPAGSVVLVTLKRRDESPTRYLLQMLRLMIPYLLQKAVQSFVCILSCFSCVQLFVTLWTRTWVFWTSWHHQERGHLSFLQFSYMWGRRGGERGKLDKCQQSSIRNGIRLCYVCGKELHVYFWVACFGIRGMYLFKEMLGVSFLCKYYFYFCSKPCWDKLFCSFLTLKFYIIWYRNLIILIY